MMRTTILTLLGILLSTPAYSYEYTGKLSYSPTVKGLKFFAETERRYEEDDNIYRHYDFGIRPKLPFLGKGWSGGLNYRAAYSKNDDGKWELERRPHAQIQKKFVTNVLADIEWALRTRQEYRMRYSGDHVSRNRSRLKIKSNKRFFGVKPFISNEIFYDFDRKEQSTNRVSTGIDLPKFNGAKSSIYLKYESKKEDSRWISNSSLVFKLAF